MRRAGIFTESLFSLRKLEDFVSASHHLRPIRKMVNAALAKMDALFSRMYEADTQGGRPSIAPEKLPRAMQLQELYSVRSERQCSTTYCFAGSLASCAWTRCMAYKLMRMHTLENMLLQGPH